MANTPVPPSAWAASIGLHGLSTEAVLLGSVRALLRAENGEEVVGIVIDAVRDLGAELVVPTGDASAELPMDVTFGSGPPLVPAGRPEVIEAVGRVLPALVEDARIALRRVQLAEHLVESARTDPLTGLPNRRVVMRVLGRLKPGDAVVMIDLDHFKAVNDEHGHDVGDAVLRAFGRALRAGVRAADLPARLGGEEFVVLMHRTGTDEAVAALERVRSLWERMRVAPVTFSAGVAVIEDGRTARDTLRRADEALYRAKAEGRARVELVR